jgi:hypothetical protein
MEILRKRQNSVSSYMQANKNSFLSYGSELRPVLHLEDLLMHHRSWPTLQRILSKGSSWPLKPIDQSERSQKMSNLLPGEIINQQLHT